MGKFIKLSRKILGKEPQKVLLQVDRIIVIVSMPDGTLIKYDDNFDYVGLTNKVPIDWFEAYYEESVDEIYDMINKAE